MADTPNYFAIIPAPVLFDTNLSDRDKILFAHISTLTKKDGFCYAGNRYFEKVMDCSVSTVKRMLKSLEDCGYITREVHYREESKEIENRYIYVNLGRSTGEPTPSITGEPTPSVTGEPDNSTSSNNIKDNNISMVVSPWKEFNVWVEDNMIKKWLRPQRANLVWNTIKQFQQQRKDWSIEEINGLQQKIQLHLSWYLPSIDDVKYICNISTYFETEKWNEKQKHGNGITNKNSNGNNPAWNKIKQNLL